MPENNFDIIISGGTLLTMSAGMDIIEDCFVGIHNGIITDIRSPVFDSHRHEMGLASA